MRVSLQILLLYVALIVVGCAERELGVARARPSSQLSVAWPGWPATDEELLAFDVTSLPVVGDEENARETVHEVLNASCVVPDGYQVAPGVAEYDETKTLWRVKGTIQPVRHTVDSKQTPSIPYRAAAFVGKDLKWHCRSVSLGDDPVYINQTVPTIQMELSRQKSDAIRRLIE